MNETIELLKRHRSIRKYKPDPVKPEHLREILACAQMASSSSHMQAYSVIGVTDPKVKAQFAEWCGGQAYVASCPLLLVWCADLRRLDRICKAQGADSSADTTENLLVAVVDASLAAQNAAVAAESLGLGIVYIGSLRNRIAEVGRVLELPVHTVPLFGMCVGYPDQAPMKRPRLPVELVYHEERYRDIAPDDPALQRYDAEYSAYMSERTDGRVASSWTEQMRAKLSSPERLHMKEYLNGQGLGRR
ncbi:oxygen-insensitive NADPH nitroreductase [Paenibacillus thermoaerophilus]|uniref:Oxygen-insensitive NADPH nitroreductase n=1 Tax=Paenibacillus thermoaerophilus TaxID=1215385 RepID=A0ABW2UZT7_9BACL|nr:oxygen-insensitive NADPH nitroreductase [Paenibacillus thermoaerophilus]TMV08235.1 oxygen-insensitive NADPH nitroreductase [Paenibacillus thermoaerophilus]